MSVLLYTTLDSFILSSENLRKLVLATRLIAVLNIIELSLDIVPPTVQMIRFTFCDANYLLLILLWMAPCAACFKGIYVQIIFILTLVSFYIFLLIISCDTNLDEKTSPGT